MSTSEVIDAPSEGRFRVGREPDVAELTYELGDGRLVLVHTGVPAVMGGQGVGGQLVRAALAAAAERGLTVVPRCPFARDWLRGHPEAAAAVAVDWEEDAPA